MSRKIELTDDLLSAMSQQASDAVSWIDDLGISENEKGRWSAKIPTHLMVNAAALSSVVLFLDDIIGPHGWWRWIRY